MLLSGSCKSKQINITSNTQCVRDGTTQWYSLILFWSKLASPHVVLTENLVKIHQAVLELCAKGSLTVYPHPILRGVCGV